MKLVNPMVAPVAVEGMTFTQAVVANVTERITGFKHCCKELELVRQETVITVNMTRQAQYEAKVKAAQERINALAGK